MITVKTLPYRLASESQAQDAAFRARIHALFSILCCVRIHPQGEERPLRGCTHMPALQDHCYHTANPIPALESPVAARRHTATQ